MRMTSRLPLARAAFQRAQGQCKKRVLNRLASCRSRKLGTAFRSLATTLSPPLRGQSSRPAPSLPRRRLFANPFDPEFLRSIRFRNEPGEFVTLDPLSAPISVAVVTHPAPTPLQVFQPFRIKAFDRPHHNKLASPDATVVFCSPLRSLSISPRIVAQNPFSKPAAVAEPKGRTGMETDLEGCEAAGLER
jgi:hypothetical protein